MTLSDPDFVAGQYRDASNLEARIVLHRRFSTGEKPLPRWIFEQLDLPPDARILELGCGPGQLWSENEERIPDGWTVTLTDASPGMVGEARERLGPDRRMAFRVAGVRDSPLSDGAFDASIANHILRHVPARPLAFSEVARVVSPGGCLYAATNGGGHMRELGPMRHILDPSHPPDAATRDLMASAWRTGLRNYSHSGSWRSPCAATKTRSSSRKPRPSWSTCSPARRRTPSGGRAREGWPGGLAGRAAMLGKLLDEQLAERGAIRITKGSGLFVARRPR